MAVDVGDPQDAAAVANALSYIFDTDHEVAQFNRQQDTLRHIQPRMIPMRGDRHYWYAYTEPYTGVRRTRYAGGNNSEGEFPAARKITHQQVYIDWEDLCEFQATVSYTGLAQRKTRSDAVYTAAEELATGLTDDFGESLNRSLHQPSTCAMALVAAVYNEDGTTYTSGQTDAFLQLDTGSIS